MHSMVDPQALMFRFANGKKIKISFRISVFGQVKLVRSEAQRSQVIDEMETENSLLVVVLDTNPSQKYIRSDSRQFFQCVDAVIAFSNAHLMFNAGNQVAIIASHVNTCFFVYPPESKRGGVARTIYRQQDGQYEVFYELECIVREKIRDLIKDRGFVTNKALANIPNSGLSSCLASSLARALAYINRKEKELKSGEKLTSRILVVSGSSESSSQYMAFMNVFFTAQKLGVIIDACVLGQYATLLSQGADLTGGVYLRPPQIAGLLQYLMWIFSPEVSMRTKLALPPQEPVDYRAACFCHRQLIQQGFVCSVCLSIFCRFTPICTTCNAFFKLPTMAKAGKKKSRIP